jgi:hypothetical protein
MNVNYPILQGEEKVGDEYGGVQFLPETFILDKNGKIVKTLFGIHSESDFEDGIRLALGASGAAQTSATETNADTKPATAGAPTAGGKAQ